MCFSMTFIVVNRFRECLGPTYISVVATSTPQKQCRNSKTANMTDHIRRLY